MGSTAPLRRRLSGGCATEPITIDVLQPDDHAGREAAAAVLLASFDNPQRYDQARITAQLVPAEAPFYRHFFVARRGDAVVGAGGIKAADWAIDTHILYMSAVAEHVRGQGIARGLIAARIAWVMENFPNGRLLVSTTRTGRFNRLGFRVVGKHESDGRRLMMMEFRRP